jgi:NAD(P)-dependent dehydrogenase (short-subunit alcohol dehydrogenase family)
MQKKTMWQTASAVALAGAVAARAWRKRRTISFAGRSVLVVGGSRGLGLVIARELAAEGARLAIASRDAAELEQAREDLSHYGAFVTTVVCDIRDRRQAEAAVDRVVREQGTIDVLINDAGVIQVGPMEHLTVDDFEDALATHFWGPLFMILSALPYMRRAGARRIVNISSIGGKLAVPHLLAYSASKFALTGLSEGLHAELAAEGFRVTTVCPGLMRTGSTYNAWFKGQYRREFAWFHLADSLPGLSIDARHAARQIIEACRRGDAELVITVPARIATVVNALFPGMMAGAMTLANRLLPAPSGAGGNEARSGWQSASAYVPSRISRLADRASAANNQLPRGMTRPA